MTFVFSGDELTAEDLQGFIDLHQAKVPRYLALKKQYESKPPILDMEVKEAWKPDNRLVVNFGKYMVDTFGGYFAGVPVKVTHDNGTVDTAVNDFWRRNNMDDTLAELSKTTSIYGVAYLYVYQNEQSETRAIYNNPLDMFIIFDDSIEQAPLFGVRYSYDKDGNVQGTLVTMNAYVPFISGKKGIAFGEPEPHYYPRLPIIEFVENEEQQALIEPVETLINAFNKAISEKANDTDYFADAYLAILGAELDEDGTYKIRDNRIINMYGTDDASKIVVEFLDKPDGDVTQENLLNRLEKLIYQTSMVANINDESFGNASGVSLEFKLQPMKNLAAMKERKFVRSLNTLLEIYLALPTNAPATYANEWANVSYKFTRNIPRNVQDEAETAGKLEGVVSKETQLSILSIVDDAKDEMARMDKESLPTNLTDAELSTRFGR